MLCSMMFKETESVSSSTLQQSHIVVRSLNLLLQVVQNDPIALGLTTPLLLVKQNMRLSA